MALKDLLATVEGKLVIVLATMCLLSFTTIGILGHYLLTANQAVGAADGNCNARIALQAANHNKAMADAEAKAKLQQSIDDEKLRQQDEAELADYHQKDLDNHLKISNLMSQLAVIYATDKDAQKWSATPTPDSVYHSVCASRGNCSRPVSGGGAAQGVHPHPQGVDAPGGGGPHYPADKRRMGSSGRGVSVSAGLVSAEAVEDFGAGGTQLLDHFFAVGGNFCIPESRVARAWKTLGKT